MRKILSETILGLICTLYLIALALIIHDIITHP